LPALTAALRGRNAAVLVAPARRRQDTRWPLVSKTSLGGSKILVLEPAASRACRRPTAWRAR